MRRDQSFGSSVAMLLAPAAALLASCSAASVDKLADHASTPTHTTVKKKVPPSPPPLPGANTLFELTSAKMWRIVIPPAGEGDAIEWSIQLRKGAGAPVTLGTKQRIKEVPPETTGLYVGYLPFGRSLKEASQVRFFATPHVNGSSFIVNNPFKGITHVESSDEPIPRGGSWLLMVGGNQRPVSVVHPADGDLVVLCNIRVLKAAGEKVKREL